MKRTFQHPPETAPAKAYWRSVEDFSNTAGFQDWLEKEFPAGASEFWGDGVSRRSFLRLMGASMALAGFGMSGCRRPEAHSVPFNKTPEWEVPGRFLNYATCMPRRRGGVPLLVSSTSGRPIKIEGNPLHPLSKGKSDTQAQASLLNLYDPDRAKRFLKQGVEIKREDFFKALDESMKAWQTAGGKGLAILSQETNSPTLNRLRGELAKLYPGHVWAVYEPCLYDNEAKAAKAAFGQECQILPRYEKADVILSLDCDFLGSDDGTLAAIRGFADGRKIENGNSKMNRLYVVESRYTTTGAMADHRLRLPASRVAALAAALLAEFQPASIGSATVEGVDPAWVREAAKDLRQAGAKALVVAGAGQPVEVHQMAAALNSALGAIGSTVDVIKKDAPASLGLKELAALIRQDAVTDLVILGGNPAYNAPADLDWAALQKKVMNVIHLASHEDETAALSAWQVPQANYLETWGDTLLQDDSYGCIQPLILPLFGGISEIQLVGRILGLAAAQDSDLPDGMALVRETFQSRILDPQISSLQRYEEEALHPDVPWNKFVHDGFLSESKAPLAAAFNGSNFGVSLASLKASNAPLSPESLELVFVPSPAVDDGRYANNGWMQELPDFMTKLTWDNAALLSGATATALGLKSEIIRSIYVSDVIKIEADGRSLEIPILIVPGHPDNTITLPLGYGRSACGKVGQGVGFNAYTLRGSDSTYYSVGAKVSKTGKKHEFAVTQEHWSMEGRDIVREAPIAYYQKNPGFARELGFESHTPPNENFYKSPGFDYKKNSQWGMVIDLSSCVGCNACVIACQSENNIPIVGKDQVGKGREMHWIRVDRYFGGSQRDVEMGKITIPNDPEVVMQPVACMQCENAPCEPVCPVNATIHDEEGLNVMAYNRCIGTRYCANNCPYKVRRFNFFDYNERQLDKLYFGPLGPKGMADTIKLSKNPNVSVRMRGVMEKCTFCVQRLESAKIDHKIVSHRDGSKLPEGSVQTACQQACPADAIVFGDLSDPASRVSQLKKRDLNYNLLDYLNTKPRLSYLSRIRNPNPLMPGAEKVGMSLILAREAGRTE
ncbi:MAG: TAT-variant-translocated molybdopterin oxidoreductase [Methylacidiphilales bacterium]|nr:TAT-variant-translocated molybdopterin oxidoreductase [Candidatus Methylacidiphilales bacterium]